MENLGFTWSKAVEALSPVLGAEAVDRWIAPLRVSSISDTTVVLEAPNAFFRDWVVAHYKEKLQAAAQGREIQVRLGTMTERDPRAAKAPGGAPSNAPATTEPRTRWGDTLNPKFSFEAFVVGASNRFAHAASMAVAESPARSYNPLYIYGGVGLGKTHLMQAIGQAILQRNPAQRVVYLSSEQFTNDLITSIQTRTTAKFRERYRTVDALLIDDIQFIGGKESTQEEFFHTFNVLYDSHKQIVLSSDQPPKHIHGLEDRLVSRFEWGLVTDMQPPDLETRIAILRKKSEDTAVQVSADVVEYIAKKITSNIRELEGALIRVVAYARFFGQPLTVATAQEILKDMVREVGARVTPELVQQRVSEHFNLSTEELKSVRRQRSILYPRQIAMYLCRSLTDASFPEIGRAFGGKDHSTVFHAVDKIERTIAQDINTKQLVEHLTESIATHVGR